MQEVLGTTQKVLGTSVEPLIKPRLPGDPPVQTLADISDAATLGWTPKVELEAGIRSMVPYIKSALESGNFK
jgi:nucleoside-diphosphate-sugar epimerase